jgi:hypothetical protein
VWVKVAAPEDPYRFVEDKAATVATVETWSYLLVQILVLAMVAAAC